VVSLPPRHVESTKCGHVFGGLYSFGDQRGGDFIREGNERPCKCAPGRVGLDATGQIEV
jgi:hypothetical protein